MGRHPALLAVLPALVLVACAGDPVRPPPPPLAVGQTVAEAESLQDTPFSPPVLAILDAGRTIAVFAAKADGRVADLPASEDLPRSLGLVFDDGRYLGRINLNDAMVVPQCLLRPDGPAQLAGRLRGLAAGEPDPIAPGADCSAGILPAEAPARTEVPADLSLAEKAGLAVAYPVGVVLAAPFVITAGVLALYMRPRELWAIDREQSLALGATEAEVRKQLGLLANGVPTVYEMPDVGMRVLRYMRMTHTELLIGIRDDRAIWSRVESGSEAYNWALLDTSGGNGRP